MDAYLNAKLVGSTIKQITTASAYTDGTGPLIVTIEFTNGNSMSFWPDELGIRTNDGGIFEWTSQAKAQVRAQVLRDLLG